MTEGTMTEGAMTEGAMTEGAMTEGTMTDSPAPQDRYAVLPAPVRLADTSTAHPAQDAPDPTWGRDTASEFMLRYV